MIKSPSAAESAGVTYQQVRPRYEKLVQEMRHALEQHLKSRPVNVISISGRAKEVASFQEKIARKTYKNPIEDIADLAGVRVVCSYESDIAEVVEVIKAKFELHDLTDKSQDLGVERMGYHGKHFVVSLGHRYSGVRYDEISSLKCEIQLRTILQDAWALISHGLVYKEESTIPARLRRDLNNVASLLEIAQGVFDNVREKREAYRAEIDRHVNQPIDFLAQSVDFDTMQAYTKWKYPDLPLSEQWHGRLVRDIKGLRYETLADVEKVVQVAKKSVEAYASDNPEWFKTGTDFITKSIGFVDDAFRKRHGFAARTLEAFKRYQHLLDEA